MLLSIDKRVVVLQDNSGSTHLTKGTPKIIRSESGSLAQPFNAELSGAVFSPCLRTRAKKGSPELTVIYVGLLSKERVLNLLKSPTWHRLKVCVCGKIMVWAQIRT